MLRPVRIWDFHLKRNTHYIHKNRFNKSICFSLGIILDNLLFSDRLLYVGKGNDQMSKSKSMGYLKISHSMISPVYQLNSVSQIHVGQIH